jgi:hypothetical protein
MNKSLALALSMTALVCTAGLAQAQSNVNAPAPTAPAAPPTVATQDSAGQEQMERSMAQGRGNAPAAEPPAATASDAEGQNLLDRKTQKVEHLHFEDAGNRVDEVRSGGQTQRITVQPKNGAPAYQVLPASPNTASPDGGIGQTGPRVWNIHQF